MRKLILAAAIAGLPVTGHAVELLVGKSTGFWTDPDATYGYAIRNEDAGGTADVDWGVAVHTPFNNLWSFDGVGSDGGEGWAVGIEEVFKIGDFRFRNGSVNRHDFNSAHLTILLEFLSPVEDVHTFSFELDSISTPNTTGDPVLDGDKAEITGEGFSAQTFRLWGQQYTLSLLGFSEDGGQTLMTVFNAPEGATAHAGVYGRITAIPPVPVPAALWLLICGVASLGAFGRLYRRA